MDAAVSALVGARAEDIVDLQPSDPQISKNLPVPQEEILRSLEQTTTTTLKTLDEIAGRSRKFQEEIEVMSHDLETLEQQSSTIHHRLSSRTAVESEIRPILQDLVVSPAIAKDIWYGEIGPKWRASLTCFENLESPGKELEELAPIATEEARNLRVQLQARAVVRSRDWYVLQLRRLRRPGCNSASVQRNLINNAELGRLLIRETPRLASALRQAYVNTMRWYYGMLFGKYSRWLGRQPSIPAEANSAPPTLGSSGLNWGLFGKTSSGDLFNLGARPTVLSKSDALPMTWTAPSGGVHFEVLLQTFLLALESAAELEFEVALTPEQQGQIEHLQPALYDCDRLVQKWAKAAGSGGDIFGLLLAMRLLGKLDEKTNIAPGIAQWAQKVQKDVLLPPLINLLSLNARSIEEAALRPSTQRSGSETTPHPMTQVFANFLTGALQLYSEESVSSESITKGLKDLASAFEAFVAKLGKGSSDPEPILHANFFVISALLSDVPGKLAEELSEHFNLLVNIYSGNAHSG